jgi:integrase
MKLTTTIARNLELPSGKIDYVEFDDDFPGFGVRVRAGKKQIKRTWIYQYDIAGRTRRITIGNVVAIGIEDARKIAGQLQSKVRLGDDPAQEKAKNLARAAESFANVLKSFLEVKERTTRKSTHRGTVLWLGEACKSLYPMPLAAITRRDIANVLTPILARGKKTASNNVRGKLITFFNWAITQGLIESNPVLGTEKQEQKSRDRVLSMAELVTISHTLDAMTNLANIIDLLASTEKYWFESIVTDMTDYRDMVHLLMLTACRRSEISELRWSEIRTEKTFIDDGLPIVGPAIALPAERVKNGRKFIVPLSKAAQAVLLRRRRDPESDLLFPRKFNGRDHYARGWTKHKKLLDAALVKNGHHFKPWVLHDLRRSVATHMGNTEIAPHVIQEVLNHYRHDTYNKSKLERPKRLAVEAWGEYLMAHIEGREPVTSVVPLLRA